MWLQASFRCLPLADKVEQLLQVQSRSPEEQLLFRHLRERLKAAEAKAQKAAATSEAKSPHDGLLGRNKVEDATSEEEAAAKSSINHFANPARPSPDQEQQEQPAEAAASKSSSQPAASQEEQQPAAVSSKAAGAAPAQQLEQQQQEQQMQQQELYQQEMQQQELYQQEMQFASDVEQLLLQQQRFQRVQLQ